MLQIIGDKTIMIGILIKLTRFWVRITTGAVGLLSGAVAICGRADDYSLPDQIMARTVWLTLSAISLRIYLGPLPRFCSSGIVAGPPGAVTLSTILAIWLRKGWLALEHMNIKRADRTSVDPRLG